MIFLLDEYVKDPKGHYFLEIKYKYELPFPPGSDTMEEMGELCLGTKKICNLISEFYGEETSGNEIVDEIKVFTYQNNKWLRATYKVENIAKSTVIAIDNLCEELGFEIDYNKLDGFKLKEYAAGLYQGRNGAYFYDIVRYPAVYKSKLDHLRLIINNRALTIKGERVCECIFDYMKETRNFIHRLENNICKVLDSEKTINLTIKKFMKKYDEYKKYVGKCIIKTEYHLLEYSGEVALYSSQYIRGDLYIYNKGKKYVINPDCIEMMINKYFETNDEDEIEDMLNLCMMMDAVTEIK